MSTIMPDPAECQHARTRPDRWDEPGGVVCSLSRDFDGCGAEDGECPRIHPAKQLCPNCLEQGRASQLTHDEDEDVYGCDECCTMFWPDQLEDKWRALEQRFRDAARIKTREVAA
jgi:hypothetical protein